MPCDVARNIPFSKRPMAGLHFDITGDNSNFLRKLQEAENGVKSTSKQIEQSGLGIEELFNRMIKSAAAFGAGFTAKELISNIIQVRGEFQQLEVAFKTMLGSEDKANTLMQQLVKTAATTPFDLQGVANGAKQLLAYGENVENVNDDLIRLGNIAAGLSQPLGDIVYLYGTTMTQGRLYTQDLNQFTGRGIPMIRELAKQFGVAENEVKSLVEAGKVGFPEVQKVIMSLTNEGGMFFNLMQEQSKTITGQISNIEDAIATMFNEIGRANEGVINDALSGVSYLVENYEKVGREIMAVVSAYGAYKAVLMSVTAYQGVVTGMTYATEIAELSKLVPAKEKSINADLEAAVASGRLTQERATEVTAIRAQISALVTKAEIEQKSAIAAVASAQKEFDTAKQRLQVAQDAVDGMDDWIARAEDLGDAELANTYRIQLAEKSIELQSASIQYNTAAKTLNEAKTKEKIATETAETLKTNVNTASTIANAKATNILTIAKTKLASVSKVLGLSLLTNPYVLAAAAIAGLTYGIYKLVTAESDTEKAIRETNNALEAQKNYYDSLSDKLNRLAGTATSESESTSKRVKALEELKQIMPSVFKDLDLEAAKRMNINEILKAGNEELERQRRIGAKVKLVQAQQELQSIDNQIVRTNNAGGYTGKLKKQREAALKSVDLWQKEVNDIVSMQNKVKEAENNDAKTQNKSFWENKKKEAEDARNALDVSQKNSEEWNKYTKQIQEAQKQIDKYSSSSKPDNQSEKIREQNNRIKVLQETQAIERQRRIVDLESQIEQSRINSMADGSEKVQAQMKLDHQKEMQELQRQKQESIRAEIQAQKELFDAQEELKAKQNKDYVKKVFDPSTVNIDKITASWDKIISRTEAKQGVDEWQKREDAMNKYLIDYGTFSQKKAAIDKKFQDAINKEDNLGAKNTLQNQWDEAISSLNVDKLKKSINWELVFGDLSKASKENLEKVRKQLKEFKNSKEYQSMDVENKKIIDEALNNIQTAVIDRGGILGDLPAQLDELRVAQEELGKAQEEYNKAIASGTEAEQEAATEKRNAAQNRLQNAQTNVQKSAEKTTSNITTLANVITELGSNSEMSLSQVGQLAGTLADTFSKSGEKIGGIIGAIFSALDSIGQQGLDGFLGNIFDSIFSAAYGAWDTVFGWTGLDFGGESDPHLQRDIENLTQSNQDLEMAIDNLADKMEETSVVESTELYNQQKSNLEQQMRNTQEMMQRSAAAYSGGFLGMGGSHSSNKKINDSMSSSDWDRISKLLGVTVRNAGDFWNLTSEQMAKVAYEATDLYTKIKNAADDGYRDAAQYMDSYIAYYKELEELQNAYYEKLTSTSFDSVKDNFRNSLLDMKDNAEAFTEDFEEMMQNALLEIMMTDVYDKRLQEWYSNFAKRVESDKELTPAEMDASKQEYLDIVEQAKAEWEDYQKIFGFGTSSTNSQSATSGGFETMSQDTATELNGRFTALQVAGEEMKNQITNAVIGVNSLVSISTEGNTTLSNILNQHVITNGYLEDIVKYTKPILEFGNKFDKMITIFNDRL